MYKTITATYTDKIALINIADELINNNIPRENFYIDKEVSQVKVMMPEYAVPEIMNILNRHHPTEVH
ncbi:MAG: hypothetical protein JKX76_07220 [Colwellia sp.]|nr:hypothetical protein [Colwellia sp.]